jgi:hypothetical protein
MPTIDELEQAIASADGDYLPVSQAGVMRRVTRAQLLSGIQDALAVPDGTLLGRTSAGIGAAEIIAVGQNLHLESGVLSGPSPFSVTSLPQAGGVVATDIVAISQGGRDAGVSVGRLLAGIAGVPGLDLSQQLVRSGGGIARRLVDWVDDALAVESFGAVGDGVTDDTAAFELAIASGQPVRLGAKTYVLNGQVTVNHSALLLGIPGISVLKRASQTGGAWISAGGPSFGAAGVVFDAGSIAGDSWGVLVGPGCQQTLFEDCSFLNANGPTLGCGLVIQARDGTTGSPSRHVVRRCEAAGNNVHGIWIQAACGAVLEGCLAHDNGAYGICLDFNDPTFVNKVRHGEVRDCHAWSNQRGISVGNYNETNLEPPRWGNANPDAIGVIVSGNRCHDNSAYGIAVSGLGMQVVGNLLEGNGSGLLINAATSLVVGNLVCGPGQFGIDAGGSIECELRGNLVSGFAVGINPGGSTNLFVADNGLVQNVWGITAYGMETDGQGTPFGIACTGLTIDNNRIELKDGSGGGVLLVDAPQNVVVTRNSFVGGAASNSSQALWAHTDQLVVQGNLWNGQARVICNPIVIGGVAQIQMPDMIDGFMITAAPQEISGMMGQHQAAMAGQVAFVKVTNGGAGYTSANVVFSGSGSGARATAYVRDGAVIGIAVTSGGSGYASSGITVSIGGNGQGAQAVATVGLPVPEGRKLSVHCNGPVRFQRVGSSPFQDNWTGTDFLVPQASVVDWEGTWGGWQAVSFPLGDYISPSGDGGLVLRSSAGDIVVRPSGNGHVRVSSDIEAIGFATLLGRGSPEGVVVAPPGSDFRNLNGGVGTTLWVKTSGSAATGWSAVA